MLIAPVSPKDIETALHILTEGLTLYGAYLAIAKARKPKPPADKQKAKVDDESS